MKRKGWLWDRKALEIRERDDYTCRNCGEWGNEWRAQSDITARNKAVFPVSRKQVDIVKGIPAFLLH